MTDHDYQLDRIATALEALLARLPDAILTQATKPPADFDGAQYAFDAMMGNPVASLASLTVTAARASQAAPATDPDLDALFGVTPADTKPGDDYAPRIRWSKVDPRSRELARLRTDAKHRAQAAKTADQREAALREYRQAKSEASRRQTALRQLWREDVIDIVNGQLVVFTGTGAQLKWRSDYLQAPDYVLTLPE